MANTMEAITAGRVISLNMEANGFMNVPPIYPATLLQDEFTLLADFFLFDHAPTYRASAKSFSIDETGSFFFLRLSLVVTVLPQVQHELIISTRVL
jgi:hypothetical protein